MKVVLVHIPVVEKPPYDFRYNEYLLMPLGILSIATTLMKNGHEVKIIDAYVERLSVNAMVKRIFAEDPDMVGIGALTPSYPMARKLILKIAANKKSNSPLIVVGGPHATLLPERLTQELPIDFLIKGEAEYPFTKLAAAIENADDFSHIPGINKTFSPDEAISVSKTIRKYDICVSANFMFGHIGDTSGTMKRTSRLSRAMDIDEATFYLLTPYPGTKTFELAKENHEVLSQSWDDYLKSGKFSDQTVAFVPKGLSAKRLLNMRRSAFLRFYLRPKIIWRDFVRMGPYYHSLKYLLKVSSFFYDILLRLFDKGSTAHEGGVG